MFTPTCQRWRDQRATYRPAGETIRASEYDVQLIPGTAEARSFVLAHHYSGSYPSALVRVGLYHRAELVGVAVISNFASQAALEVALPLETEGRRAELGRFVLLDRVPANGETWFLARVFELLRAAGFAAIAAHSDPGQRETPSGLVFKGHIGTIYQASNAIYTGLTPARTWRMGHDGTVISDAALGKLRLKKRGWEYVRNDLIRRGAPEPSGEWRAWCTAAIAATSRPHRHRGTHRYLWALDKRLRPELPAGKTYPKVRAA